MAALLLTSIAGPLSAQTTDTSFLSTAQNLQPVEVRGVRAGSDAPFAKTELNAKDIARQNVGQDFPYLLQYTPSAVTTSDAGAGVGYTGLRVRGTDGTRINVTLNGIPVNDAESQGTFFVNFGDIASSTGSVQLQRGVGTSTNGAGAFGATLSIDNLGQRKEAGADASISFGSFNTQRYTVKAGTGLLKGGFQFDVRMSKIASDGYMERSASDLKALQLLGGWQISPKTNIHFMVMTGTEKTQQAWNGVPQDSLATHRRYNELGLKSDGTYYNDQTDNYQQDYYQLFGDHRFSKYLTGHVGLFYTRGKGYYNEYRTGQSYSSYGLPDFTTPSDTISTTDLIRQLWLDNHFYGGVFSLLYEKNKTGITFGGGFNQYTGDHYGFVKWADQGIPADYRWYLLNSQKNDFNLYAKGQQTIGENLILFADLQYRHVTYFMNGFRDNPTLKPSVDYHFFNPKAGLTWLLKRNAYEKQKLYASVAVANKEPNRNDFEASPTALPKPERLIDFEGGYELNKAKWTVGANLFYMRYKDQLILTGQINDVGAYTRTNVPNSYRAGIELQGAVTPLRWLTLGGNFTYSQNKILDYTEYLDEYDADFNWEGQQQTSYKTTDIAFSPNTIGSLIATFRPFRNSGFEFDVIGKHVGMQYLDNTSNSNRSIDAYNLADVRLRYRMSIGGLKNLGVNVLLNNVLDTKYESNGYTYGYNYDGTRSDFNYYFPQAGFNILAGINLEF